MPGERESQLLKMFSPFLDIENNSHPDSSHNCETHCLGAANATSSNFTQCEECPNTFDPWAYQEYFSVTENGVVLGVYAHSKDIKLSDRGLNISLKGKQGTSR